MKRQLNLKHCDLAFRFNICHTTISRILMKWIFLMDTRLSNILIKWPDREALKRTVPFCFCIHYGLRVPQSLIVLNCLLKSPLI